MGIKLSVQAGPHQGRHFEFNDHDRFIVGRSKRAQFRLPLKDKTLSRIHFMVEVNPPDCRLGPVGGPVGAGRAGSPQGLLPGAPTDPGVHVKCTRFVTSWSIAVPHMTRSFRGDTLTRHGVLGVVPTPRPQRGAPFAPRGPEGPFPRFNATMGRCDFLRAFSPRFVSFARRYLRSACISSPHGRRRVAGGSSRSLLYRSLPIRSSSRSCQDLPRSRETRAIIRHVPPTPV